MNKHGPVMSRILSFCSSSSRRHPAHSSSLTGCSPDRPKSPSSAPFGTGHKLAAIAPDALRASPGHSDTTRPGGLVEAGLILEDEFVEVPRWSHSLCRRRNKCRSVGWKTRSVGLPVVEDGGYLSPNAERSHTRGTNEVTTSRPTEDAPG